MAAIDALAAYLEDEGVGTVGASIYLENMPDDSSGEVDTCLVIYSTGGAPPGLTQGDNTDQPSWQLRARSLDSDTATGLLEQAFDALHGLTEQTLHGVHFKLVFALQSNPVSLGRDEKQRFQYVQNYRGFVAGVTR